MTPEPAASEIESAAAAPPTWIERAPESPWWPPELGPRSAWTEGRCHADICSELLLGAPGWSLVGASRRGRLHAHRGDFREDAFRIAVGEGFFVLVAADGAGSCRLSRIGSEYACDAAIRRVRAALEQASAADVGGDPRSWVGDAVGVALSAAVADVDMLARNSSIDPKELRTTLLAAVWWPWEDREYLVSAQVGDGFVALRRTDGTVERLCGGDSGEFSGEVSCFVPDDGAARRARATVVIDAADVAAIILGTDGVEDPFYPIERHGSLLFSQLAEGVAAPAQHFQRQELHGPVFGPDGDRQLIRWLGFERRGENDDRTLVAAWR